MKRTTAKVVLLSILVTVRLSTTPLLAQGVTGTWKRTAMLLNEANGKTEDLMNPLSTAIP